MKRIKIVFFIIIGILTVALTTFSVIYGMNLQTKSLATAKLAKETSALTDDNEKLKNRESVLKKEISEKTDETTQKNELNKKIEDTNSSIEKIKVEIIDTNKNITDLNSKTEALKASIGNLTAGMDQEAGTSKTYKDTSLICPNQLEKGRYTVSGTGSITIMTLTNSVRIFEDLGLLDTNSFTFNLDTGETLKIQGEIKLVELK